MDRVVFQRDSSIRNYNRGEVGVIVGFCQVGDYKETVAIVRKKDGHYVNAPLGDIIYNGKAE